MKKVQDGNPAQNSEFAEFLSTLRTHKWYATLGRPGVCTHLYRWAYYPWAANSFPEKIIAATMTHTFMLRAELDLRPEILSGI
jgi:hypothetical protein